MKTGTGKVVDQTFAELERAAANGKRCPKNISTEIPDGVLDAAAMQELARKGRIKIEISGRNYRVVTILVGPHAGKKTAPKAIADDIRDVYAEAKANGFDTTALRAIIRLRKQDAGERNEQQLVLETYLLALGMLPDFEPDPSSSGKGSGGGSGGNNGNHSGSGGASGQPSGAGYGAKMAAPIDGAGPGPSTLAVASGSSPAASRRGGPSPVTGAEPASGAGPGGGDRTAAAAARPAAPAPRPLQEWHTPHLVELDPATELPTFLLRDHPDCPVRATGPPAARPP